MIRGGGSTPKGSVHCLGHLAVLWEGVCLNVLP